MHYTNTFNEILYKQLFEENDTDKDEECCLITDDTLEEDHIKLVCNHKFNYIPLYKELSNQKNRNYLETSKLHTNQIKCPYCRTIQDGLIPFNKRYPELKKKGVNYPPSKYFKSNTVLASDNAPLGLSCTSINTALIPQPAAALTKKGINSLCPPEILPIEVGS